VSTFEILFGGELWAKFYTTSKVQEPHELVTEKFFSNTAFSELITKPNSKSKTLKTDVDWSYEKQQVENYWVFSNSGKFPWI